MIRGINLLALLVGVVVDTVGDVGTALFVAVGAGVAGITYTDVTKDWRLLAPGLVGGCGAEWLAGWVAGRIAKQRFRLHGLLVGVLTVIVGRLIAGGLIGSGPVWLSIGSAVVSPPIAMLGGVVAGRTLPKVEPPK